MCKDILSILNQSYVMTASSVLLCFVVVCCSAYRLFSIDQFHFPYGTSVFQCRECLCYLASVLEARSKYNDFKTLAKRPRHSLLYYKTKKSEANFVSLCETVQSILSEIGSWWSTKREKRRFHVDSKVQCVGARPLIALMSRFKDRNKWPLQDVGTFKTTSLTLSPLIP